MRSLYDKCNLYILVSTLLPGVPWERVNALKRSDVRLLNIGDQKWTECNSKILS